MYYTAQELYYTAQGLYYTAKELYYTAQGLYYTAQELCYTPQGLHYTAQGLSYPAQELYYTAQGLYYKAQGLHYTAQRLSISRPTCILPLQTTSSPTAASCHRWRKCAHQNDLKNVLYFIHSGGHAFADNIFFNNGFLSQMTQMWPPEWLEQCIVVHSFWWPCLCGQHIFRKRRLTTDDTNVATRMT